MRYRRESFVERFTTCGKTNCACATGAKHGPFYYLTAHVGPGNIRKILLKTPAQQAVIREAASVYHSIGSAWKSFPKSTWRYSGAMKLSHPLEL